MTVLFSLSRHLPLLGLGLGLEAAFGYPKRLYAWINHPVGWIGFLIDELDWRLNHSRDRPARRRVLGAIALFIIIAVSGALGIVLAEVLAFLPYGWTAESVLVASLVAERSLYRHVRDVAQALVREGLARGRQMIGRIVGRDPQSLDEAGIARAAIESLAENFSDGVVAPAFWYLIAGLPGVMIYKAVNTADSMIGHQTPRHRAFGFAAAKVDDLLNLLPARLSGFVFAAAAGLMPNADGESAFRTMVRDAGRHRSPNAGWPEAAMAGALSLKLGGPRVYAEGPVDGAWLGQGRNLAGPADIERALKLYLFACGLIWAVVWLGFAARFLF